MSPPHSPPANPASNLSINLSMPHLLEKICRREDLSRDEMGRALHGLIQGEVTEVHMAALLTGLRIKGEAVDEVYGAARAMRDHAVRLPLATPPQLDVVGTGGDGAGSINLSTAAAFVAAAHGVTVAKHYNRSVSSQCGSADVMMELGLGLDHTPPEVAAMIEHCGIGFLFAPTFHPATRAVADLRRKLAIRTIFNILGPLTNPSGVTAQLVGVYHPSRTRLMAETLREFGSQQALVVSAEIGLDEISPSGVTYASQLKDGEIHDLVLSPADFGSSETAPDAIMGGKPAENALALRHLLQGKAHPARVAVTLNAAAALLVAGAVDDFAAGFTLAKSILAAGKAWQKCEELVDFSHQLKARRVPSHSLADSANAPREYANAWLWD
ncbi:MAG: anthranilate phosphoribosyltransferase [Candidatus Symbiobacter sp.]|nr:anthranilate phosphoribosyltransferase [Candidatus Symbiobacter sp.]